MHQHCWEKIIGLPGTMKQDICKNDDKEDGCAAAPERDPGNQQLGLRRIESVFEGLKQQVCRHRNGCEKHPLYMVHDPIAMRYDPFPFQLGMRQFLK